MQCVLLFKLNCIMRTMDGWMCGGQRWNCRAQMSSDMFAVLKFQIRKRKKKNITITTTTSTITRVIARLSLSRTRIREYHLWSLSIVLRCGCFIFVFLFLAFFDSLPFRSAASHRFLFCFAFLRQFDGTRNALAARSSGSTNKKYKTDEMEESKKRRI